MKFNYCGTSRMSLPLSKSQSSESARQLNKFICYAYSYGDLCVCVWVSLSLRASVMWEEPLFNLLIGALGSCPYGCRSWAGLGYAMLLYPMWEKFKGCISWYTWVWLVAKMRNKYKQHLYFPSIRPILALTLENSGESSQKLAKTIEPIMQTASSS